MRQLAQERGIPSASRQSSAGICFIGAHESWASPEATQGCLCSHGCLGVPLCRIKSSGSSNQAGRAHCCACLLHRTEEKMGSNIQWPGTLIFSLVSAGRRNFGDFISDYTAPVAGDYVDVDTRRSLGPCVNMLAVTLGQGSRISGLSTRCACPMHLSRHEGRSPRSHVPCKPQDRIAEISCVQHSHMTAVQDVRGREGHAAAHRLCGCRPGSPCSLHAHSSTGRGALGFRPGPRADAEHRKHGMQL